MSEQTGEPVINTRRTGCVADAFARKLCFICLDVLLANPDTATRREVPAHAAWIGPSPKFLCVLLCEGCWRKWLAAAYASSDPAHWPTAQYAIGELGVRGS